MTVYHSTSPVSASLHLILCFPYSVCLLPDFPLLTTVSRSESRSNSGLDSGSESASDPDTDSFLDLVSPGLTSGHVLRPALWSGLQFDLKTPNLDSNLESNPNTQCPGPDLSPNVIPDQSSGCQGQSHCWVWIEFPSFTILALSKFQL